MYMDQSGDPDLVSDLLLHIDKVMSRKQWHIGVYERHLIFKGHMQLNYNILVFMHFYAMVMFQFA